MLAKQMERCESSIYHPSPCYVGELERMMQAVLKFFYKSVSLRGFLVIFNERKM